MKNVSEVKAALKAMGAEYAKIRKLPEGERKAFGDELNRRKAELVAELARLAAAEETGEVEEIDLTAPARAGEGLPIAAAKMGSKHPLMTEMFKVMEIYARMGFKVEPARQLDDEYHMFESLNFPAEHPARDGYDTFRTAEGFIPPAHTSTMQNRILKKYRGELESLGQIAAVVPGRVFRNEDADATHEHTFYQCEGVFVSKTASLAEMLGVLKEFFEAYYGEDISFRTQPGYFPFTEPSLEFLIKKPAVLGGRGEEWLEMLGCGMIHPNVLEMAGIDPKVYRGFAWGGGIDRLVMLKRGIGDVRYFESGKLDFLLSGMDVSGGANGADAGEGASCGADLRGENYEN